MMDQRPLRLGDRVDDYCPRERRLTNHVVTVMQGDEITHTRCSACDADHSFKHGKMPAKRKSSETGALYDAVLAGVLKPKRGEPAADTGEPEVAEPGMVPMSAAEPDPEPDPVVVAAASIPDVAAGAPEPTADPEPPAASWGHRPLIRATLPRPDGQAPVMPRPIPEFTMHHRNNGGPGRHQQGGGFGRHRDQGRGGRSRFPR